MAARKSDTPSPFIVRLVRGRPWLSLAAALIGVLMFGLTQLTDLRLSQDILLAWNIAVCLYLGIAAYEMFTTDEAGMRRRAEVQDVGKWAILALTLLAVAVCLTAIIGELAAARTLTGVGKAVTLALAGLTIFSSWLFVHTSFALHYAHAYYVSLSHHKEACLAFPDKDPTPDYADFLYFAFIIGTSAQTADVSITSKSMRRLSLGHCVFAFFFNTTLLAVAINLAASLLG